jgi:hypothetical protein
MSYERKGGMGTNGASSALPVCPTNCSPRRNADGTYGPECDCTPYRPAPTPPAIRVVTPSRTFPDTGRELTPAEEQARQARLAHERTYVENRCEAAEQSLRNNLRFFNPNTYNDPYAGLAIIMFAAALAPAAIAGGWAGRRHGKMWTGAAVGTGATIATAVLLNPAAIMLTGRRNPLHDAYAALSPQQRRTNAFVSLWPLALATGGLGFAAAHCATKERA